MVERAQFVHVLNRLNELFAALRKGYAIGFHHSLVIQFVTGGRLPIAVNANQPCA